MRPRGGDGGREVRRGWRAGRNRRDEGAWHGDSVRVTGKRRKRGDRYCEGDEDRRPLPPASTRGAALCGAGTTSSGWSEDSLRGAGKSFARRIFHAPDRGGPGAGSGRRGEREMRRPGAVALNTFREAVRDRVLYNLVFFALLMMAAAIFVGGISIGIEEMVIKSLGLSAISVIGLFIAVFIGLVVG